MQPDILFAALPATIGLSFAALIVLIIAAVQEARHGSQTADIVRRGYLYLVSFVTLLIASAALAGLLHTGLKALVFTKADVLPPYQIPPGLYLPGESAEKGTAMLQCASSCTLTADQQSAVTAWEGQYREWKRSTDPGTVRSQSLVTSLSFLLIAGIVYLLHWILVRRDAKRGAPTAMRITHLWSVSFIMLIVSVVAAAFLLNTALKALLLKTDANTLTAIPTPVATERAGVDSVATCGDACGLAPTTVELARDWQREYTAAQQRQWQDRTTRDRHNAFAQELAFLLVALPLFAYHFRTVWRESRHAKDPAPPRATFV